MRILVAEDDPHVGSSTSIRCKTALHGRHSTPVEVILRLFVLKQLFNWGFEQTEKQVCKSPLLQWFCRVSFEHVPDDTTLLRWAQLIRPETMHALNDRVVELAVQAKVVKGRKLREDWYLCPDQHPSSD